MTSLVTESRWRIAHWFPRLSAEGRAGLSSLGWTGLAQFLGLTIRLASNILLTRLLAPEAYGVLGAAMAVITTLEWLSDLGVQPALVRHPKGDRRSYLLTGWWMGLTRGLALTTIAAVMAKPYAEFAQLPELAAVLSLLALKPTLMALRSPAMPTLRKSLDYRAVCVDEVAQTLVGTAVSLILAWLTRSIWAIVFGTLAGTLTAIVTSYLLRPMRPRVHWNAEAAKAIAQLGHQVLLNTLVMAVWLNMDRLLGVRFMTVTELGLYAVAWNLSAVLEGLLSRVCDVYFSMLSRRREVQSQYDWHEAITHRFTCFAVPLGVVGIVLAPAMIRLLYDARYAAAGPLFAVMVARLLVRALGQVQFQYLLVRAEVHLSTQAYLVALLVQAALFAWLVPWLGPMGLALASLGSTTTFTFVQTWLMPKREGWGLSGFSATVSGMVAGLLVVAVLVR